MAASAAARSGVSASDFTDMMDAFFGGSRRPAGPRPRVRRGQDALVRLDLELAEAAFGTTKRAQGRHRGALPELPRLAARAEGTTR